MSGRELWVADPQPWKAFGACSGLDPLLWFPERGEPVEPARAICRGCPVQEQCLEYALASGEKFGIWGGLSERERRRERQARNRDRRGAA